MPAVLGLAMGQPSLARFREADREQHELQLQVHVLGVVVRLGDQAPPERIQGLADRRLVLDHDVALRGHVVHQGGHQIGLVVEVRIDRADGDAGFGSDLLVRRGLHPPSSDNAASRRDQRRPGLLLALLPGQPW